MGKRVLLWVLSTFCVVGCLQAQTWFVSGQVAYEIKIPTTGLYGLVAGQSQSQNALLGTPIAQLKVFHNGRQVALHAKDVDNSGSWTVGDTLYFFGKPNKGEAEVELYHRPSFQNPESPLYGQAGKYYLISSPGLGLRMGTTVPRASATALTWKAELSLAPRAEYSYGNGNYQFSKFHQSYMGLGEGWCSPPRSSTGGTNSYTLTNPYVTRNAQGKVVAWFNGRNSGTKTPTLSLGNTRVLSASVSNYNRVIDSASFNANGLGANVIVAQGNAGAGLVSLMLARVSIPVTPAVVDRPALLVSDPVSTGVGVVDLGATRGIYLQVNDPYNPKILAETGNRYTVEPDSGGSRTAKMWLQRHPIWIADSITTTQTLNLVAPPQQGEVLFVTSRNLADSVAAYAAYRASVKGGQHIVRTVFVEDMYSTYTYGYPSPVAIRRYLANAIELGVTPKSVFLIGKGLQHSQFQTDQWLSQNLVPTWGVPASDNLLAVTDTGRFFNKIPISRLAAKTGADVALYLQKVKAQEASSINLWSKQAAHLSGGKNAGEIDQFRGYIQNYTNLFEKPLVGGSVYQYSKQTSSVIEAVNIRNRVNEGLGIMTLFGHSASTTTDIDIGAANDPAQGYENMGKCPLIVVNGCFAGNIFERTVNSLNENWVLAPNRGAIAFSGSMDEGLPSLLNRHTELIYRIQYRDTSTNYKTLGEVYQETNRRYILGSSNVFDSIMVTQTILHGDPLLRLFPHRKADFAFNTEQSRLIDQDLTAFNKSFSLRLSISNQGIYNPSDSVTVLIKINTGGAPIFGDPVKLLAIKRDTVIDYRISGGFELNNAATIECILDYLNTVPETSEENNSITFSLGRFESGISFITPSVDAIVGTRSLNLIYRTLANSNATGVQIEVDTSRLFTSSSKLATQGGATPLAEVPIVLPFMPDSTVFYLRYRLVGLPTTEEWKKFAFTYIANQEGWSQSTGYQFFSTENEGFLVDSAKARKPWRYVEKTVTVRLKTVGAGIPQTITNTGIDVNGIPLAYGTQSNCVGLGQNRLLTLRLRKVSLEPYVYAYQPPVDEFWRYSCGRVPTAINFFDANVIPRDARAADALSSFNISQMAVGDFFFGVTQGSHNFLSWRGPFQSNIYWGGFYNASTFIGTDTAKIRRTQTGAPMAFHGIRTQGSIPRIGYTLGPNILDTINDTREAIDTTFIIRRSPSDGRVVSPFIGPAISFRAVLIGLLREAGRRDSALLTVRSYADFADTGRIFYQGNVQSLTLNALPTSSRFIKLFFEAPNRGDSTSYLASWRVLYTPYPEGVAVSASAPTPIDAGDTVRFSAKFHHSIGRVGDTLNTLVLVRTAAGAVLDSLKLQAIRKPNTDTSYVFAKWKTEITSPDSLVFEASFNWDRLKQERNFLNNSAFATVTLKKDTGTYAGYFEIDGTLPEYRMLTSNSPEIVYRLNRDFADKQIILQFGESCDTCNILPTLEYTKAGNQVRFNPKDLKPALYEIRSTIQDRLRLLVPTQVAFFEVIARDTLTLFRTYPNPVRDNATFVYQCAAAFAGGIMELRVYNSYGKEVYTGGATHSGLIAGKVSWDLRHSGQKLEPGVYLAQLRITANGSNGAPTNVLSRSTRVVVVR
jgi:Peptidase family C25